MYRVYWSVRHNIQEAKAIREIWVMKLQPEYGW
jgi:hypothetical protein